VFTAGNHSATVNDFTPSDLVVFKASADDFNLVADPSDGHAVVTYDGSTISLAGISPDQLTAANFLLPQDQHPLL